MYHIYVSTYADICKGKSNESTLRDGRIDEILYRDHWPAACVRHLLHLVEVELSAKRHFKKRSAKQWNYNI